jgi:flagellar motor switch protein FliG
MPAEAAHAPATASGPGGETLDYAKLNRQQKLALFLIVIGPEGAADILRQFDDAEVEALCREMGNFKLIPDTVRQAALEELAPVVGESAAATLGGLDYARRALEIARGDYKATTILSRVGANPAGSTASVIAEIAEMESRQIYNLVKQEQPQTIAFILSYLSREKSTELFGMLPPEFREEVAERLGTIESTSVDLVAKIVRNLGRHLNQKHRPAFHASGGVRSVADLLNGLDKEMAKALLGRLEERNARLGAAIRRKMFSFEDLSRLQASDLQRVMREVDSGQLAIAMKSSSEGIREKIYGAISKRAAESLRDEISMLGPVRLKDVEVAQDSIIQVVRRLEEDGSISLDGEGGTVG